MRTDKDIMNSKRVAYCAGMSPEDYKTTKALFPESTLIDYSNYRKTYDAVASGECEAAVLPIEKSMSGEVGQINDLFFDGDLHVNAVVDVDTDKEIIRYAVVSAEETAPAEDGKRIFIIQFTVKDEPGCLAKAITTVSDYGFNMRVIRSRHMKDLSWNYYFYVEIDGDDTSENGQNMLAAMKEACQTLKVLGRYNA